MSMKNIHNAYLEDAERDAQPNTELRDKLAQELFAKPDKKPRWAFFAMPAFAMATIAIALMVVMKPEPTIELFALHEAEPSSADLFDGGNESDDGFESGDEASGGSDLAPFREVKNLSCVEGCDHVMIIDGSRPESAYYDSGDCQACNEVMITANRGSNGQIHIGGYAILAGDQRSLDGQVVDESRMGETFSVSIPGWNGSSWDHESPEKTFSVTLTETGEWNLVDEISCEDGCAGYNVITDRGGAYTIIYAGCPIDPCRMMSLYQAPEYGSGDYVVSFGRPMGPLDQTVDWEIYEQSISSDDLQDNPSMHIRASAEGVTCEFDIVE